MRFVVISGMIAALLVGEGEVWAQRKPLSAPDSKAKSRSNGSQLEAGLEIDRIEVLGVRAFSSSLIEGVLEVAPGDHLERLKVVRTEEALQSLYIRHGYDQVSIRSSLVRKRNEKKNLEIVLQFEIKEGKPVRIADVKLVPNGILDEATQKYWKEREKKLRNSLNVSVGEVLDQEKIADGRRAIQERLASEEYVGAKVDNVSTTAHATPSADSSVFTENASRWVSVEFRVDLGERVTFGFRGNKVFTRGYLDNLVDEQRLIGLSKDYLGAIKTRIEEEYRGAGYAQVEITPYSMEGTDRSGRRITYLIREGPRVKIESIDFDGNSFFSSKELRNAFYSRASALVQHDFYFEKDVQKAADLLVESLKEKGYLSARLVTINSTYVSKPRTHPPVTTVKLLIYLYEGGQTVVQGVSTTGVKILSTDEVKKILHVKEGAPLNLFSFGEGIEVLKKVYRDRGYLGVRILNEGTDSLIKYSEENHRADIDLQLEEGNQARIGHVEVEGLVRTQENVVLRELNLPEGEVLGESLLTQNEIQLKRLGIFSSVNLRVSDDPTRADYKTIRIAVVEADRGILAYGPGFRNDLGIRAFGQLSYTNLWGMNHTVSVNASANRRFYLYNFAEGQIQVSYLWPWFLGAPNLTFRPTLSIAQTQYINFAADTVTASALWEKPFLPNPSLIGSVAYTVEKIRQFNAVADIDNKQLLICSVTPRLTLDLRDNPLSPTSGLFSTAWVDLAEPFLGTDSDIGLYRVQFRTDYHIPIFKGVVLYLSLRSGYEQSVLGGQSIPLIKQFALGGIGSLRGFQEQSLNYQTSLTPVTTLSYVNYRTQLDLPFSGALKFGVFFDAANLMQDSFSFSKSLRSGTGIGFHYQTPVGPVNLDLGFNTAPQAGESPYVIHFSVGII